MERGGEGKREGGREGFREVGDLPSLNFKVSFFLVE